AGAGRPDKTVPEQYLGLESWINLSISAEIRLKTNAGNYAALSIISLPAGISVEEYRFHTVGTYAFAAALLFHFLFIFLFYFLGVIPLAVINIGSTALWVLILYLHKRGRGKVTVTLAFSEINLHSIMCVIYLGWGAGFQYYIFTTPMLLCLAPFF
ncbi:MAG: hypothetical protein KMY53_02875, partial [Desulfarculus sp.]|nr:hypothetical protein [Pseudomonadota bacterium]MBV1737083.1 hypothetical protein [Desulfarculus sp.]